MPVCRPPKRCSKTLAIFLVLARLTTATIAQIQFSNPAHITTREGLSDNRATCIEQDGEGFMWFGTMDGLCRYDGLVMKVFKSNPGDPAALSYHQIKSLLFDKEKNVLWIGTSKGLNVLDLRTEKFRVYLHNPRDAHSIPGNMMQRAILKDRQGNIWIGFENDGFVRYNRETDDFTRFLYPLTNADKGEQFDNINTVTQIRQDLRNDSILWLGTYCGVLKFNHFTGVFTRYYADLGDKGWNISANLVAALYLHPDGRVFSGSYGRLLNNFNPSTGTYIHVGPATVGGVSPQGEGVVTRIVPKSDRELWVTTNRGLFTFDTKQGVITAELRNDPANNLFYGVSFIDEQQRIWHNTDKGVFLFDPLGNQFLNYPLDKNLFSSGFSPMKVLKASGDSMLYINVSGSKGLYLLNRKTGAWNILSPPGLNARFIGRDILYLQDGRLLVVEERMLYTLSPGGGSLIPFPLQPGNKYARFMSAVQDYQGRIWLASVEGGLFCLDLRSGSTRVFYDELLEDSKPGKSLKIGDLFEDSRRNIWVRITGGFAVFDHLRDTIFTFRYHPDKPNTFMHITNFAEDGQGNILIGGSKEEGIGMADLKHPEKGIVRKLDWTESTRVSPNILLKDAGENLWIKDDKDLYKLNLQNQETDHYDGSDGLFSIKDEPKSININDLSMLPSGEIAICYGTGMAIGIFHPDSLRKNREVPKPYLVSFSVFEKELTGDTAWYYRKGITLPYSDNFFSFKFSAIAHTHARETRFKYKLDGFDPNWISPTDDRRYAAYSNVPEGVYTLRIMAANKEGIWNENAMTLHITILPPWYRSWWAYLGYVLALSGAVFSIYQFLKRRWALQTQIQIEHAEALRLRELDEVKTRLYTNITHEFRTPLTVISGMADQIGENPQKWLDEGVQIIKRNSNQLLRLVNQMLDLRRLEAGKMPLHFVQGDVLAYLKYLLESFHSQATAQNIGLAFETELPELVMDYDPEKLQQIVSNLVSNALKFTPEGGRVQLKVSNKQSTGQANYLLLRVQDTGIGIPEGKLPFVFDRFYQADDHATRKAEGSGIGLALTKELVKLLGGEITAENPVPGRNEGAQFTVTLPVTRIALPATTVNTSKISDAFIPPVPAEQKSPETPVGEENDHPLLLIIEDNPDVVRYLRACLEQHYRLAVAHHGKQGVEMAFDLIPDIVISDVMMPEMDGFEVTQTLKNDERSSHIPVVLLTAKADIDSKIEGLERGADAYLAKPFDKEELLVRLRKLLELRTQLQKHYLSLATSPGSDANRAGEPSGVAALENAFVEKVKAIVETHLDDSGLDLLQLCRAVGMSNSQLHRKMTALTGLSPNRFIRSIRLSNAKTRLLQTENTVSEIAYETGFNDPDYFIRAFREEFGMPPAQFRKANRKP